MLRPESDLGGGTWKQTAVVGRAMAERTIPLKYGSRCRRCGRELAAGTTARWNPDTKWVACVRCPTPPAAPRSDQSESRRNAGPGSSGTAAPVPNSPWRALARYHLAVTQRVGVAEPPALSDQERWTLLPLEREDLVTGRQDTIAMDRRLGRLAVSAKSDEVLYYGWPTVVATDRSGRLRIAPLLMTELEPPSPGQATAVPRDDQPYVNPGLLADTFFPLDSLAIAEPSVDDGLPFGDPVAMQNRAIAFCAALELAGGPLDVDRLTTRVDLVEGVHNVAMAFRGPSNLATLALVDELKDLADREDAGWTSAGWLLAPTVTASAAAGSVAPEAASTAPLPDVVAGLLPAAVSGLALNDSQEQALASAISGPLTVVTGPPGTGKSQLVAAVVANQWLAGRSVLVASTNNGAVDVAARRCAAIDEALLVRTGNRERRDELPQILERLAARGAVPGPSAGVIRRQLEAAAASRQQVQRRLAGRTQAEADLARLVLDVEALRTMLWGASAPSPVHDRRRELLALARKARGARWGRARRERRLFAAAGDVSSGCSADDIAAWAETEIQIETLTAELAALGHADPAQDRADLTAASDAWGRAGMTALVDTVQQRLHGGAASLQQLARMRAAARAARTAAVARALPHVPGWACTALSARHNFPLTAGLFDLLILDEASQCSVAEVLPLAYRAKRILVVGDPNQLTPVVTLTKGALESAAVSAGVTQAEMHHHAVSAGQDSAFTAFAARVAGGPQLLDEHYRCHPEIARFFNEEFYGGALRVLTDVTAQVGTVRGFTLVDVRGETSRGRTGGAYNSAEADAVVAWVLAHLDEPGTLGVVTPFAAQAELILRRLSAAVGEDVWAAKEGTVGTAHRFQGDERDVMLFSTVLAAGARAGTARWVEEQRNLVNVAVSRARRALVVFADTINLAETPVPTLHALVGLAARTTPAAAAADAMTDIAALHSEAERRLFEALARLGHAPVLKPVVEGYELDFAFELPAGRLNIEVDGVHHTDARGRQRRQDLARDHILEGLGWRVLRLPAWRCLAEPDTAAQDVVDAIRARS